MQTFCVIQGDATDVPVYIKNPVNLVIDRVVFTCKSLNIQEDLIPGEVDGDKYNDDEWLLRLSSEKTSKFGIGSWSFDVTALDSSNNMYTAIHNGMMTVKNKENKVKIDAN